MRPFLRSAKVIPRGCSRALQRAITDFAADQPFAQVRMKLQEHYGFEIGESTIQRIALGHAKTIFEASRVIPVFPETPGKHKDIIAQTDGGMVPIVEPDAGQKDKRKGKTLYVERGQDFAGARQKGSTTPVYAGAIEGGVETKWDDSFSNARFGPASARTRAFMRSGTERHGSWAKWRNISARKAAT